MITFNKWDSKTWPANDCWCRIQLVGDEKPLSDLYKYFPKYMIFVTVDDLCNTSRWDSSEVLCYEIINPAEPQGEGGE